MVRLILGIEPLRLVVVVVEFVVCGWMVHVVVDAVAVMAKMILTFQKVLSAVLQ